MLSAFHTHIYFHIPPHIYTYLHLYFHSCARCDTCIRSVSVYTCTHTHTHLDLSPSARSVVLLLFFFLQVHILLVHASVCANACTSCSLCSHSRAYTLLHSPIHAPACPPDCSFFFSLCTILPFGCCALGLLFMGLFLPPDTLFFIEHCACAKYS